VHAIFGSRFYPALSPIPDDTPIPDSFRKYLIITREQADYERQIAEKEAARRNRKKERATQSRRRRTSAKIN
jgi:hypothetical protein